MISPCMVEMHISSYFNVHSCILRLSFDYCTEFDQLYPACSCQLLQSFLEGSEKHEL